MALDPSERGTNPQYNYVDRGYYAARMKRYLELLGTERVHVLFFEDFVKSTREEMERVFSNFSRSTPSLPARLPIAPQNQGGAPKNRLAAVLLYSKQLRRVGRLVVPPRGRPRVERSLMQRGRMDVDDQTRQGLYELYADDWMQLKEFLGKSPPWANGVSADGSPEHGLRSSGSENLTDPKPFTRSPHHERTGSSWLTTLIDSHPDADAYGEVFLPAKERVRPGARAR